MKKYFKNNFELKIDRKQRAKIISFIFKVIEGI